MAYTETKTARFAPGTIIIHKKYGYRGLIFDVDAVYSQSPEWYNTNVQTSAPKDRPWYHVLVDGEPHTTYVAEENLLHLTIQMNSNIRSLAYCSGLTDKATWPAG